MIGFGYDGAAVNIGQCIGVKALIQSKRQWVVTIWCFAHRLELALRDAQCQEQEDVVSELKKWFDSSKFPGDREVQPLMACGTRFIAHKVSALERIKDRYGAYSQN